MVVWFKRCFHAYCFSVLLTVRLNKFHTCANRLINKQKIWRQTVFGFHPISPRYACRSTIISPPSQEQCSAPTLAFCLIGGSICVKRIPGGHKLATMGSYIIFKWGQESYLNSAPTDAICRKMKVFIPRFYKHELHKHGKNGMI